MQTVSMDFTTSVVGIFSLLVFFQLHVWRTYFFLRKSRLNPSSASPFFAGSPSVIHAHTNRSVEDSPQLEASSDDPSIEKKSIALNIDNIHLTFPQYLWGVGAVGITSVLLWAVKVPIMALRYKFKTWALAKPCDYDNLVAKFLLETSLAVYFVGETRENNCTIGRWRLPDVRVVNEVVKNKLIFY